ncbi:CG13473 [Drosophila busckii]|uniref:CG13473 n=1 Tax=Drosophila busckii TaxID=30019 RepID=A0A0M4EKD0_DROBS|nr:thioredoxin-2 [Drosophila busckii]ALC44614.1 CG13473 [Drosophila busckii]
MAAANKPKKVITITSKADFEKVVAEAGNKHVLVEFFAAWCGPCAIIGPKLEEFAQEYEDCLLIVKIDVDDNEDLAEEYNVSSMPSFLIIKNKITLEQFVGSNSELVQRTLKKFCRADEKNATDAGGSKPGNKIANMLKVVAPTKLATTSNQADTGKSAAVPDNKK